MKALREEMLRTSISLMMEVLWIRPNGTLPHWEIKQALLFAFFFPPKFTPQICPLSIQIITLNPNFKMGLSIHMTFTLMTYISNHMGNKIALTSIYCHKYKNQFNTTT